MSDKYKPYKSSFKYKVQLRLESKGWTAFPICDSSLPIELLCLRVCGGKKEEVGVRAKAHGHIYQQERDVLIALGNKLQIGIFYVHEAQSRELVFTVLVPLRRSQ